MTEILVDGCILKLDDEDVERVQQKNWYRTKCDHFYTMFGLRRHKLGSISLQRFILNYTGPLEVAHKDGQHFNFQKSNLEPMTHRQNMQKVKNNTSGHAGVYMQTKQRKPWCANIWLNGKNTHIGSFYTKEEAVAAREKFMQDRQLL